ncbi:MAG: ATP synthase F1 subunit epsilon [Planctomycetota bacterium]|jgi:F-type H+-transporting ATPase subunit epsilon
MTAENTFRLDVISPSGIQYEGNVISVIAEGTEGSMGVLRNHATLLTGLKKGAFTIKESGGNTVSLELEGGFMDVRNNSVVVLTETAG